MFELITMSLVDLGMLTAIMLPVDVLIWAGYTKVKAAFKKYYETLGSGSSEEAEEDDEDSEEEPGLDVYEKMKQKDLAVSGEIKMGEASTSNQN